MDILQNRPSSTTLNIDDVIFRTDLYPRLETSPVTVQKYAEDLSVLPDESIKGWCNWTNDGVEVSFGLAFGPECPESLRNLTAGIIKNGTLIPYGSVAAHYAKLERRVI